ncbi:hypothetical protein [Paenibacillus sp. GP183]|uniref:hypothetical protein n=1 Tax=Paenibacillus sp. GP183 TaxID=1882751 RepID=UPI00089AD5FF|nr:hypothetical protein [Paenibacillus sp. GP183]SEC61488.1 hypothetical protein SAMN05443246_4709 [Paenibacillus sp. GP183]
MRNFIGFMLLVLILAGCSNEATTISKGWSVTPTIDLKINNEKGEELSDKWIGETGRLAISNNPFIEGKAQKYMWLLWGNQNDLVGKSFKVIATSEKGEEKTVLSDRTLGGSNWGAQASLPSMITLPTLGLWKLDAFVENKLHGTIIVKVGL